MVFRIHFEFKDGSADHIDLSGDTVDEIRERAMTELAARQIELTTAWSEQIQ